LKKGYRWGNLLGLGESEALARLDEPVEVEEPPADGHPEDLLDIKRRPPGDQ
jgi:hypothetical protein